MIQNMLITSQTFKPSLCMLNIFMLSSCVWCSSKFVTLYQESLNSKAHFILPFLEYFDKFSKWHFETDLFEVLQNFVILRKNWKYHPHSHLKLKKNHAIFAIFCYQVQVSDIPVSFICKDHDNCQLQSLLPICTMIVV